MGYDETRDAIEGQTADLDRLVNSESWVSAIMLKSAVSLIADKMSFPCCAGWSGTNEKKRRRTNKGG